jgi:hypothetical protein
MLSTLTIPQMGDASQDEPVLARESYLRELISTGRNLRVLAQRHSNEIISRAVIQTSPQWKNEMARDAIRLDSEGFDFKSQSQSHLQSLQIFENESMRGEIFQTWISLTAGSKKKRGRIHSWTDGQKALVLSELDESTVIEANAEFIASALEVNSVEAYPVGEAEDVGGKAKMAFPLEPGIAFL